LEKGLIFDIQGYSVHDGPGCRTLVFMSGCPLNCSWCSNPEGIKQKRQMMFRRSRCVPRSCRCADACPKGAVARGEDGYPVFDRSACDECCSFECAGVCMKEAVRVAGRDISVQELMRILRRDQDYWGADGGVTFTGGEPLMQAGFLKAALEKCRESYMHTAVETCGCVPRETLLAVQQLTDFMFIDLKHMDSAEHRKGTGRGNELVLDNIGAAAGARWDGRLVLRMPLIPGFNDGEENLAATAKFMKRAGVGEINILSFHRMGGSKYEQLGQEYRHGTTEPPAPAALNAAAEVFRSNGVECHVDSETPF